MTNVKCYQGGARSSTVAGCNSTIELAPNSKVVNTRHLVSVFLILASYTLFVNSTNISTNIKVVLQRPKGGEGKSLICW